MALLVICGSCHKEMNVPDLLLGKMVRCPQCQTMVRVTHRPVAPPKPTGPAPDAPVVQAAPLTMVVPAPIVAAPVAAVPVAVATPARRSRVAFTPFDVRIRVLHDPRKKLRGRMVARVSPEGLHLRGDKLEWRLPIGTAVRHAGLHHFNVLLEDREVKLSVDEPRLDNRRLSLDLVAFLLGERDALASTDYWPTRWPVVFAPLPLIVTLAVAALWLIGVVGLPALAASAALGLSLTMFAALLLWFDHRVLWRRLAWPVAATAIGIVVMPVLYFGGRAIFYPGPSWTPYRSPDGHWAIQMPYNVRTGTEGLGGGGQIQAELFEAESARPGNEFSVMVVDLSQPTVNERPTAQRFEDAKARLLTRDGTQLVKESNLLLNGRYAGREMEFTHPKAGRMRVRIYVVDNRLYRILVGGKDLSDADMVRFLESFELLQPR
jgi:hypothetical protein